MTRELIITESGNFAQAAADLFAHQAAEAIAHNGRFTVALSGGSTPAEVFRRLAKSDFRGRINHSKVFYFFGDERNVTPDSSESNFRLANENLFRPLNISKDNIFRWRTELGSFEAVVADYEQRISDFFNGKTRLIDSQPQVSIPRFDLILLGLGVDGHTASLFPLSPALREGERIVAVNWVEKLEDHRFTMTFPIINNAANVVFYVKGIVKAQTLKDVFEREFRPDILPAQLVAPTYGSLYWLMDESAASLLTQT